MRTGTTGESDFCRGAARQTCVVGYVSTLVATIAGYAYLAGYILLLLRYPVRPWSGIQSFAESFLSPYGTELTILQALAFLQTLSIAATVVTVCECIPKEQKVLARLAQTSITAFLVVSCSHYFIQWASVRQSIISGNLEGVAPFVQFNFSSPISAFNMLGWTILYSLSALALSTAFKGRGTNAWIRWGLVLCGVNGIAAGIGLALGKQIAYLFWTIGISLTWYVYPLLMSLFKKELGRVASAPRGAT